MFKKFLLVFCVLILTVFLIVPAQATSTVDVSPDAQDITDINNLTPGSARTFLGTRLRGLLQEGSTTGTIATTAIDTSYAVHRITSPDFMGFSPSLGNGYSNQLLTIALVTDGGEDLIITPTTKTGFTSVTWDDAGDSCTFRYVDSTVGWVVVSNNGVTVTQ